MSFGGEWETMSSKACNTLGIRVLGAKECDVLDR